MKDNKFNLKFNLVEPDTGKTKASLNLGFLDSEEKKDYRVIVYDNNKNPVVIQEQEVKKSKGILIDFLSKFGNLSMIFDSKNKQ